MLRRQGGPQHLMRINAPPSYSWREPSLCLPIVSDLIPKLLISFLIYNLHFIYYLIIDFFFFPSALSHLADLLPGCTFHSIGCLPSLVRCFVKRLSHQFSLILVLTPTLSNTLLCSLTILNLWYFKSWVDFPNYFQNQLCNSMCYIWEIIAKQGLVFSEARHPLAQQVSFLTTSDMDSSHSLLCRVSLFQEFLPPECLEGWTLLYLKAKQCAMIPKISSTTAVHKINLFSEILATLYVAPFGWFLCASSILLLLLLSPVSLEIFQRR